MEYKSVPSLLKELWAINLRATLKDSYGKAVLLIDRNEQYDANAEKAVKIIAKQKALLTFELPNQTALV